MKTVVILGGGYSGVLTAHRLLKKSADSHDLKVILVAPNTHLFWNIAGARAMVPGVLADETIFAPIAPGFKQYPAKRFEFVLGAAESLDISAKKLVIAGASGQTPLTYDILILATGSHTKGDVPFKGKGSTEATKDALHDFQNKVKQASSIYVAGAGATGVETAGELAFEYKGKKNITLVASGPQILEGTPPAVTKTAMKQLLSLGVTVKKIVTDLYLPTIGLAPNSSFIPQNLLNANGFVIVDSYLRVTGAKDVWAVGDISAVQRPQFVNADNQSKALVKNLELVLAGKGPLAYKVAEKDMLAVPVGRKVGTGHMGSMKLPSFMVNMIKGKTLFTEKLQGTVNGSGA